MFVVFLTGSLAFLKQLFAILSQFTHVFSPLPVSSALLRHRAYASEHCCLVLAQALSPIAIPTSMRSERAEMAVPRAGALDLVSADMIALHWVVITTGTRQRRPQDFAPRHLFTGADHRRRLGLPVKAGALTFGALE
jgi:hypothetical protein